MSERKKSLGKPQMVWGINRIDVPLDTTEVGEYCYSFFLIFSRGFAQKRDDDVMILKLN